MNKRYSDVIFFTTCISLSVSINYRHILNKKLYYRKRRQATMSTNITLKDINQRKWPKLAKRLQELEKSHLSYYCPNDKLPAKNADFGKIYLLIRTNTPPVCTIEAYNLYGNHETVQTLTMKTAILKNVASYVHPADNKPYPKPIGRPRKYGVKEAQRIKKLQSEGISIRKIAKELDMSTNTVQRLINAYIK